MNRNDPSDFSRKKYGERNWFFENRQISIAQISNNLLIAPSNSMLGFEVRGSLV